MEARSSRILFLEQVIKKVKFSDSLEELLPVPLMSP